ncbi:hypothetical protein GCM10027056_23030 [Glaciibacter psychrotolerans]
MTFMVPVASPPLCVTGELASVLIIGLWSRGRHGDVVRTREPVHSSLRADRERERTECRIGHEAYRDSIVLEAWHAARIRLPANQKSPAA